MNYKNVSGCGIIAALYFVLCSVFSPLSFGPVQVRIATALVMAVSINKKIWPGVLVGVTLANFFSPLGVIDVAFGLVGAGIGVFFVVKTKNIVHSAVLYSIATGVIVGIELAIIYSMPYIYAVLSVFGGNLVSCIIGVFLLKAKTIQNIIKGF